MSIAKRAGSALLWLVIVLCLAATIIPRYLDRIYYRGPVTGHYDGQRFFNPDGSDDVLARGSRVPIRYLTGSDGKPPWPTHVPVGQSKPAARVEGRRMVATWIGHATVLVQTQGLNILTDPIWSATSGPFDIGPHRVADPGVRFEDLPKIDLVLVSHDHYDHMDVSTLKRLWDRDRPLIVTSLGNDAILRSAGIPGRSTDFGPGVQAMDWGDWTLVHNESQSGREPIYVGVTRNHHWGSRWFTDRNRALWSSFVVRLPGGNIFFAGDTGFGNGKWADEARAYGPIRLALLPIGAFRFGTGGMGIGSHIGPVDAVEIYRRLGAQNAIAVHWGTFRLSYEAYDTPPLLLRAAMKCAGQRGFIAAPLGGPQQVPSMMSRPVAAPMTRAALLKCLDTPAVRALR